MQTIQAKESPVITKTRELCEVLVSQDSFKRLKGQVDAFLADPKSQTQYQDLSELQSHLVGKQRSGMTLSQQEIDDFETARRELMANTVASGFIEAQRLMEKLQEEISSYVQLAFELGRAPTAEEVEADKKKGGCCGGGCGGGGGGGCGSGGCG